VLPDDTVVPYFEWMTPVAVVMGRELYYTFLLFNKITGRINRSEEVNLL
jgi:hypothetical protein